MRLAFPALTLALALIAAPAQAEPAAAPSSPAAPPAASAERKICRASVATGSIMQRKTCHTRAEWERIDAETADAMRHAMDRRSLGGTGGAPGLD